MKVRETKCNADHCRIAWMVIATIDLMTPSRRFCIHAPSARTVNMNDNQMIKANNNNLTVSLSVILQLPVAQSQRAWTKCDATDDRRAQFYKQFHHKLYITIVRTCQIILFFKALSSNDVDKRTFSGRKMLSIFEPVLYSSRSAYNLLTVTV